jgi:hypothetical protein
VTLARLLSYLPRLGGLHLIRDCESGWLPAYLYSVPGYQCRYFFISSHEPIIGRCFYTILRQSPPSSTCRHVETHRTEKGDNKKAPEESRACRLIHYPFEGVVGCL